MAQIGKSCLRCLSAQMGSNIHSHPRTAHTASGTSPTSTSVPRAHGSSVGPSGLRITRVPASVSTSWSTWSPPKVVARTRPPELDLSRR